MTECSPVCVENPYGRPTRPGSIGVPIPGFEARVVDERDREVKRGEVGELIVRGPGVMKGYLHQPEATEETLRGGWLHTGDLARQDEEDYIYIVDRKKDMILVAAPLIGEGYVIFSVGYRLFGPGERAKNIYPAQLDDCQRAVRWIRAHADQYGVDPQRIGAIGASAGGLEAVSQLLSRIPLGTPLAVVLRSAP